MAAPARRVGLSSGSVELIASSQNGEVLPGVALLRGDVSEATVEVLGVVPADEVVGPEASVFEGAEAASGELRAILGGAKERLGVRIVVRQ